MSLRRFLTRLRSIPRTNAAEQELSDEIRAHLEMEESDQREAGLPPAQARDAARRVFGNVTRAKESSRDAWIFRNLEVLAQDLRYALRKMRRNPGFTAIAILTLALGVGANTAIFSLINNIMLRNLPVQHPDQLVLLNWTSQGEGFVIWSGYSDYGGCDTTDPGGRGGWKGRNCSFSYPMFDSFHAHAELFQNVAAYAGNNNVHLDWGGQVVTADAQSVSGGFFSTVGVNPLLGRLMSPADDQTGVEPVVVLQFDYWQKLFNGDPGVIGKTIALNGAAFTVIGVTPPEFFGLQLGEHPSLWIPLHSRQRLGATFSQDFDARGAWLYVLARLKPGVKVDQGRSELESLFRSTLAAEAGAGSHSTDGRETDFLKGSPSDMGIRLTPLKHGLASLRKNYSAQLFMLMVVTGLVLLIACANVANLLLSRGSSRRHEIAVRVSVGAGRMRLVRQLMTESLLLALTGGAVGVFISFWASRVLGSLILSQTAEILQPHLLPDSAVFIFAAGIAALAAVAFGLGPAFATTRIAPGMSLKSSGGTRGNRRTGRALVTLETAIALVLLIGAGMFVRSLIALNTVNPGFRVDHLLTFTIAPELMNISDDKRSTVATDVRDRLVQIPGVESVTWSNYVYLAGSYSTSTIQLEGSHDAMGVSAESVSVGPHFFHTMAIPVLAGRDVDELDCKSKSNAMWINHLFAERYFPNVNPLGKHTKGGLEIVGVVGDTKSHSLRSEIGPAMYWPGRGGAYVNFELRSAQDPAALEPQIHAVVTSAAPNLLIEDMKTQVELIAVALTPERTMAQLSSCFGLLAIVLASIGVYGVLAYSVARRTSEIAVRMSLGAMPNNILRLVVREGLSPVIIGIFLGLLGAYGLTRLIETALFGVKPLDALTFGGAAFVLLGIAALACYFPARRAMRVDPMTALRYE